MSMSSLYKCTVYRPSTSSSSAMRCLNQSSWCCFWISERTYLDTLREIEISRWSAAAFHSGRPTTTNYTSSWGRHHWIQAVCFAPGHPQRLQGMMMREKTYHISLYHISYHPSKFNQCQWTHKISITDESEESIKSLPNGHWQSLRALQTLRNGPSKVALDLAIGELPFGSEDNLASWNIYSNHATMPTNWQSKSSKCCLETSWRNRPSSNARSAATKEFASAKLGDIGVDQSISQFKSLLHD